MPKWTSILCLLFAFTITLPQSSAQEKRVTPDSIRLAPPSQETLKERAKEKEKMKGQETRDAARAKELPRQANPNKSGASVVTDCEDSSAGVKEGFAILYDKINARNRASLTKQQALCTCMIKSNTELKGCADLSGKKLMKMDAPNHPDGFNLTVVAARPTMKKDDPRIQGNSRRQTVVAAQYIEVIVTPLVGKTNCRLFSENDKYIVALEPTPPQTSSVLPKKDITISKDGDQSLARWDFITINEEDPKSGFYMVTREETPRALYRNLQNELKLKDFSTMDGKAKEKSEWNYTVAGVDDNGHTRYIIRPNDDPRSAIAVDERTKALNLTSNNVPTIFAGSTTGKYAKDENKNIYWNVDRVF